MEAFRSIKSALKDEGTENVDDVLDKALDSESMIGIDGRGSVSERIDGERYCVEFYDIAAEPGSGSTARVAVAYDADGEYSGGWIDYEADVRGPVEWDKTLLEILVS